MGGLLSGSDLMPSSRFVPNDRETRQTGNSLFEELNELSCQLSRLERESRDIAAGPREIGHEPVNVNVVHSAHDNRNTCGGASRRADALRSRRNDHVNFPPNQFGGERWQLVESALR